VLEAALWGLVTSGSLLVGAVVAALWRPGTRVVGLTMAFGAGALMSAVAYDLVADAFRDPDHVLLPAAGLAAGALAFFAGDELIDRRGGHDRKSMEGAVQAEGSPLAIVLGSVLDGVPESAILGATLVEGEAVSAAFIVAVFLSNLPEAISATSGLAAAGWRRGRIFGLWSIVVAVSTATAALAWLAFDQLEGLDSTALLAFAAGAMLVMLADTMFPGAFRMGGRVAGLATTLGFALAFAISQLE